MSEITSTTTNEFWKYLGTVWGNLSLEDKALVEEIWKTYAEIVGTLTEDIAIIENNRSIEDIDAVITVSDNYYDVIYATTDDDTYGSLINTFTTISGLVGYNLGENVIGASGIVNYYYLDEDNTWVAEPLTLGTDYTLSGQSAIIFLNDPPFTNSVNYPTLSRSTIYVDNLYKINPVLFKLWGNMAALGSDVFVNKDYESWSFYDETDGLPYLVDTANHYKQLIRNLHYWSRKTPTVKTIRNLLGAAYGLPFAYAAGTLTHNIYEEPTANGAIDTWLLTSDTETLGTTLVTNGDMELDSDWVDYATPTTNERSTEQAYDGIYSRKFIADDPGEGIKSKVFTTVTGERYTVEFYVYAPTDTTIDSGVRNGADTAFVLAQTHTILVGEWQKVTYDYTESAGGASAYIAFYSTGLVGTYYIDSVSIKPIQTTDTLGENTGTLFSSTSLTYGSTGMIFNGSSYLNCGEAVSSVIFGNDPHSFSARIYMDAVPATYDYVVAIGNDSAGQQSSMGINSDMKPFLSKYSDLVVFDECPALSTETWYNLVVTFDGTTAKCYVDNVLVDSVPTTLSVTTGKIRIGANVGNTPSWDGEIYDVRIYDKALTTEEVEQIYTGDRYYAEINDQRLWFDTSAELAYVKTGTYERGTLLVDTYNIYDYTTNSGLVETQMNSLGTDKYNLLVAEISADLVANFPFTKNDDTYDEWVERTIPKQLKFIEVIDE